MTTVSTQFVPLTADEFRGRLREALAIYVEAMRYPPGTAEQRAPMWLTHALRDGWRCFAALDAEGTLLGVAYGYRGNPGQWWHEQVRRGLVNTAGEEAAGQWLGDYFELTEIHVRPRNQAGGIGETLLRRLLDGVPNRHVLLSTPEGPSRAWKLYRRVGFVDVLRDYHFAGDPRPFAILGRALPLEPPGAAVSSAGS
ncbi:ribosomal protein S18 acetylase RimI-like enzyme [Amycolatopsis bartoniae]|uniref:Acetyltransferase n=1 Tax=Amycolatopsis bartoniae TaxID=941986 RepID=A0A8H9J4Z5_9PSEU|nr:GNAT family N-acetyltransferase [Amycolatopsis bartoniae]MBB2933981.1 ribosomal protein S18 acetylase RimI-like enzyme [Amycolatopsis bartoniae]TVT02795.1 GNAT family N-acetyltransferase [Amycolatopsis bartoniae]GHF86154.1 acetyltransferase [Amycolatopsis bartoniae]